MDAVENLIKKHEAFEKSAATQEERFSALEKLTTVSIYLNGVLGIGTKGLCNSLVMELDLEPMEGLTILIGNFSQLKQFKGLLV